MLRNAKRNGSKNRNRTTLAALAIDYSLACYTGENDSNADTNTAAASVTIINYISRLMRFVVLLSLFVCGL